MTGQPWQSLDDHGRLFRRILGRSPTSVTVITAIAGDGAPIGMSVGTLISVSLDPPLIGFLPMRQSATFERMRAAGCFCANVLADDQEDLSRRFASRADDKFAEVAWASAPSGAPHLEGVVAAIDCTLEAVIEVGDHWLSLGRVTSVAADETRNPLVFLGGLYGSVGLRVPISMLDFEHLPGWG